MALKEIAAALAISALIAGCATQNTASPQANDASAATPTASAKPGARSVKSKNGNFDGEIIGTPAATSKFATLEIGMSLREVSNKIGAPDDMVRHETGKRWIPFYLGNDAQRLQVLYKGEGCLTYTGGNVFGGGGNELIAITVDPKGQCLDS